MIDLARAAGAIGARLEGRARVVARVGSDSRAVLPGDLFVALEGERFDGHAFVAQAFAAGATAALVREGRDVACPAGRALLRATDPLATLAALGAWWRGRLSLPVVGITGSNGKTTVKEMTASICRVAAGSDSAVLATAGNLNNQIGVPLTLLRLAPGHRYAVIEMGMNHPGEIAGLTRLARPTVAVVNNATAAHLEGLGTVEAVARAKGEIFEGLGADGVAVVNADSQFADYWRGLVRGRRVIDFGLAGPAVITGTWRMLPQGSALELAVDGRRATTTLAVAGEHNVRNALAAAACAFGAGIGLDAIAAGLGRFQGVKGRLQRKAGRLGTQLIDDTYNANPASTRAAIDVLAAVPGRKLLALGDMRELGPEGERLHREIGAHARAAGIDALYATGELMAAAVAAFGSGGRHFATAEALADALAAEIGPGTTVLVKGSRSMRMERVVAALVAEPEAAEAGAH